MILLAVGKHLSLNLGSFMDTFRIAVTNLLTLAGLWTLFCVVRPSVTNLLTLAGLWTLFRYKQTDLEKVKNCPQAENSECYNVLKIAGFATKDE